MTWGVLQRFAGLGVGGGESLQRFSRGDDDLIGS